MLINQPMERKPFPVGPGSLASLGMTCAPSRPRAAGPPGETFPRVRNGLSGREGPSASLGTTEDSNRRPGYAGRVAERAAQDARGPQDHDRFRRFSAVFPSLAHKPRKRMKTVETASGPNDHRQRPDAADEVGIEADRRAHDLRSQVSLQHLLPQDLQLQLGQAVADAAVDAGAERQVLAH